MPIRILNSALYLPRCDELLQLCGVMKSAWSAVEEFILYILQELVHFAHPLRSETRRNCHGKERIGHG